MKKTDCRHYNRSENRNLSIEMDLHIFLVGKFLTTNSTCDSTPCIGIIDSVELHQYRKGKQAVLKLNNGAEVRVPVKYGKLAPLAGMKFQITK